MNSIKDLANQYFRAFSNKDIDTLEEVENNPRKLPSK